MTETQRAHRQTVLALAAMGILGLTVGTVSAAETFFIAGTGTWDADANWAQVGGDATLGTGDDVNVQPGLADAAIIFDNQTVNLNSTESVLEVQVATPASGHFSGSNGTARLNVGPGAALTTNGNSAGMRVGRGLAVGQALGTSRAEVVQTGGSVFIAQGTNGVRLSAGDSGNVADSFYQISGGTLRGGAGGAGIVSDLRVGQTGSNFNSAEFHVVGSGPTEIRFLDVQVASSTAELAASGNTNGHSIIRFSLDAGGVTPIIAEDEFQFRTTVAGSAVGLLMVDLIAEAPQTDITLVIADRLGNNGSAAERFYNYGDGDLLVASGAGWDYSYLVDYTDASDDGVLDASIVLRYQSRSLIPEPSALSLLGLAGLALVRRRRA